MEKNEPEKPLVSFKEPLIVFALPFILFLPTLWHLTVYFPEHAHAPESLGGVEQMRRLWGHILLSFILRSP